MHTVDSVTESSGLSLQRYHLNQTNNHMARSANSNNTHLPGCAEKQSRNTTASKHPETQQSLTLYLSRRCFSTVKESKAILSTEWSVGTKTGAYDIQTFLHLSILFILRKALPVLNPHVPTTCLIDVSFKQQNVHFDAGLCREPWAATWMQKQTVSRQLDCHFDFVSMSESSKGWISNSDRAATNQTVTVCLPQGEPSGCCKVSQSDALFSEMVVGLSP